MQGGGTKKQGLSQLQSKVSDRRVPDPRGTSLGISSLFFSPQNKPEDHSPGLLFYSNLILLLRFIPQLYDFKIPTSENVHISVDERRAAYAVMVANLDVEHLV